MESQGEVFQRSEGDRKTARGSGKNDLVQATEMMKSLALGGPKLGGGSREPKLGEKSRRRLFTRSEEKKGDQKGLRRDARVLATPGGGGH